jgi:hypothetical protein
MPPGEDPLVIQDYDPAWRDRFAALASSGSRTRNFVQ